VVIAGRTDEDGIFKFEELPKGVYYFREFDAPAGYLLDETPIRFEVLEHGVIVKAEMTNQRIERSRTPQTGDDSSPVLPLLVMGIAFIAIVTGCVKKRKAKKQNSQMEETQESTPEE